MKIAADLHIHSSLSPCGSLEMSPRAIVERALERKLDLIAVTDHNSVANSLYAAEIGRRRGLTVVCGMEAQSREDVHVLCLFTHPHVAEAFFGEVYPLLPPVDNNPDYFGDQVVVDGEENVVRMEPRLLVNGLDLGLGDLAERVRSAGGYVIPAHVESAHFSLLANLGVLPPELDGCPLEVSYCISGEDAVARFPCLRGRRLITNSDAHFLADIGRAYTVYDSVAPTLAGVYRAAQEGRFRVVRPES